MDGRRKGTAVKIERNDGGKAGIGKRGKKVAEKKDVKIRAAASIPIATAPSALQWRRRVERWV